MKKYTILHKTFIATALLLMIGCSEEDNYELGQIAAPTNLQITAEIVGQDDDNPNGDGTGIVNYTATADGAIGYKFYANGQEFLVPGGKKAIPFSTTGLRDYRVTVAAIGTGGTISSASVETRVLVLYAPPAELLEKLHGGSSKTWRIKAEGAGHFGLGPPNGAGGPEWYAAGPNEKVDTGMYDDRYIFGADGSFQHQTNGDVLGRGIYLEPDFGAHTGAFDNADALNYPIDDYSGLWTLSAPGGAETLTLSGLGFIAYYTGSHQYKIRNRANPNEMQISTTDGNSEFEWWFIITSE